MAEIEITTTGEVLLSGTVVGHITWARPYIEADVAGTYDDLGHGFDEFGDCMGCSDCDDKDEEISLLEVELAKKKDEVEKLTRERDGIEAKVNEIMDQVNELEASE